MCVNIYMLATVSGAVGGCAVSAAVSDKFPAVAALDQGVQVAVSNKVNAATASPIAAIRSPLRLVLLTPESGSAVTTVTGGNEYLCLVDEFHDACPLRDSVRRIEKALPPG